MHECDGCTSAPAFEGGVNAAVAGTNDNHLLSPIRVSLDEVVSDVWEIFSGDAQVIWIIVIPGCKDHGRCTIRLRVVPAGDLDSEAAGPRAGYAIAAHIDNCLTGSNV